MCALVSSGGKDPGSSEPPIRHHPPPRPPLHPPRPLRRAPALIQQLQFGRDHACLHQLNSSNLTITHIPSWLIFRPPSVAASSTPIFSSDCTTVR